MSGVRRSPEKQPDEVEEQENEFAKILTNRVRSAADVLPLETPMSVLYRVDPAGEQE